MTILAEKYGRYGYRRIAALLREEGFRANHKRVERLWRQEGPKVPRRQRPHGRLWLNDGSCVRSGRTTCGAMTLWPRGPGTADRCGC
jgi:transposase InsO family protein